MTDCVPRMERMLNAVGNVLGSSSEKNDGEENDQDEKAISGQQPGDVPRARRTGAAGRRPLCAD